MLYEVITFLGVDDQEVRSFVKTVHRADFDAVGIFALDAILGNYKCHVKRS